MQARPDCPPACPTPPHPPQVAFFWLFAAALIAFSYWLSSLFSSSRVAGTATQFIYALAMMPGWVGGWGGRGALLGQRQLVGAAGGR